MLAKAAVLADNLLNKILALVIIIAVLFCSFAMWDTYRIFNAASVDSSILKYKPTANSDGTNPSLSELGKINSDVRAWLTIDDTGIDYPVLQGTNNLKYLNTNIYGNYALAGSVFLDFRNSGDFSDKYSLLYGHHMDAGAMFGDLTKFETASFFSTHKTGKLFTVEKTYNIRIFACANVDAFNSVLFAPGDMQADYDKMPETIKTYSVQYDSSVNSNNEKIIGLSTCSDVSTTSRTVLFGYLSG